jgi:hypothetical protein
MHMQDAHGSHFIHQQRIMHQGIANETQAKDV